MGVAGSGHGAKCGHEGHQQTNASQRVRQGNQRPSAFQRIAFMLATRGAGMDVMFRMCERCDVDWAAVS